MHVRRAGTGEGFPRRWARASASDGGYTRKNTACPRNERLASWIENSETAVSFFKRPAPAPVTGEMNAATRSKAEQTNSMSSGTAILRAISSVAKYL